MLGFRGSMVFGGLVFRGLIRLEAIRLRVLDYSPTPQTLTLIMSNVSGFS